VDCAVAAIDHDCLAAVSNGRVRTVNVGEAPPLLANAKLDKSITGLNFPAGAPRPCCEIGASTPSLCLSDVARAVVAPDHRRLAALVSNGHVLIVHVPETPRAAEFDEPVTKHHI
jgi:hypothetical protein